MIFVWVGCIIGCAVTKQFFFVAVMFVVLVLFLYVRYQFNRGRTFLGRVYDKAAGGAAYAVKKTSDFVQNK